MAAHKNWRIYKARGLKKKGFSSFQEWRNHYYALNPNKHLVKLEQMRQWRKNNPDYRKNSEHRKKRAVTVRTNRQNNPEERLSHNLRTRLNRALRKLKKSDSTMRLVGCSLSELRAWLEGWFEPGMTWENYGKIWHVDHNRPCASFDLSVPREQSRCFSYLNLRPLFASDNISKHDKWIFSSVGAKV